MWPFGIWNLVGDDAGLGDDAIGIAAFRIRVRRIGQVEGRVEDVERVCAVCGELLNRDDRVAVLVDAHDAVLAVLGGVDQDVAWDRIRTGLHVRLVCCAVSAEVDVVGLAVRYGDGVVGGVIRPRIATAKVGLSIAVRRRAHKLDICDVKPFA
jgi:hypothetical protein